MVIALSNGDIRTIEFKRDIVSANSVWGSSFSTDDKDLQKAIENHKYFGKKNKAVVWTDDVVKEVKEVKKKQQAVKD